uniref:Uncharacterized protein n=1 Tax=Triticum urartu TaxID=4572 RepID=A0A8R7TYV9_TRIUA
LEHVPEINERVVELHRRNHLLPLPAGLSPPPLDLAPVDGLGLGLGILSGNTSLGETGLLEELAHAAGGQGPQRRGAGLVLGKASILAYAGSWWLGWRRELGRLSRRGAGLVLGHAEGFDAADWTGTRALLVPGGGSGSGRDLAGSTTHALRRRFPVVERSCRPLRLLGGVGGLGDAGGVDPDAGERAGSGEGSGGSARGQGAGVGGGAHGRSRSGRTRRDHGEEPIDR